MTASISTSWSSPPRRRRLRQLHVLDTTQTGHAGFQYQSARSAEQLGQRRERWPSRRMRRLLALVSSSGDVLRWPADLDTNPAPAAPDLVKNLGAGVAGLTLSSDGKLAFVLGPGNQIQALDLAAATVTPITVLPAAAKPSSMALVSSTAPDMLAVADQTNLFLHLVSAAAGGGVDRQRQTRSSAGRARRALRADTGPTCWKETPTALFNRSALMRWCSISRSTPGAAVQDRRRQPADRHDRIGQASLHSLRR